MNAYIGRLVLSTWVVAAIAAAHEGVNAGAAGRGGQHAARSARTLRLPVTPYRYAELVLPSHFTESVASRFDNTPPDNPVTDHGATLGRVLFYDTRLSGNDTTSCGSCHVQARAFVDPERFSRGYRGALTDRHAMNLVNLRYNPRARFFWDERAGNLDSRAALGFADIRNGHAGHPAPHQLSRLRSALQTRSGFQAMTVTSAGDGTARIAVLGANLARHIEQFGLTPSANSKAHAAVARYQAALTRRGEDERAVLVGRMRGIMTGEERESFDASLQRRSALAIGRPGEAGGIVGGVVAGLPEPPVDPVTRPEP